MDNLDLFTDLYDSCLDEIQIILDEDAKMPTKAHEHDAGFDIYSRFDATVPARGNACFDTGVHMLIPAGYTGFLKSKSGLNVKHNITSDGVIDAGYTGSIVVKLYNHGDVDYEVKAGDKISQIVILPVYVIRLKQVEKFNGETDRGDNGFGSSGK